MQLVFDWVEDSDFKCNVCNSTETEDTDHIKKPKESKDEFVSSSASLLKQLERSGRFFWSGDQAANSLLCYITHDGLDMGNVQLLKPKVVFFISTSSSERQVALWGKDRQKW